MERELIWEGKPLLGCRVQVIDGGRFTGSAAAVGLIGNVISRDKAVELSERRKRQILGTRYSGVYIDAIIEDEDGDFEEMQVWGLGECFNIKILDEPEKKKPKPSKKETDDNADEEKLPLGQEVLITSGGSGAYGASGAFGVIVSKEDYNKASKRGGANGAGHDTGVYVMITKSSDLRNKNYQVWGLGVGHVLVPKGKSKSELEKAKADLVLCGKKIGEVTGVTMNLNIPKELYESKKKVASKAINVRAVNCKITKGN